MAQIPHADEGPICPLHREPMSNVCHKCPWWTKLTMKDPQSEQILDDWRCAVAWMPILLIEGAQKTHQAGVAIESLRNELVAGVVEAVGLAAENAGRLLDARHDHHG